MTNQMRNHGAWGRGLAVTVLALGGVFEGCGGGGGDGGGACADGQVQAFWDVMQNGAVVSCLPGDTVVVRVDDNSMTQPFACSAGQGVTPPVVGGVHHSVDLTLFDGSGNVLEQSPAVDVPVPCGGIGATPVYDFTP